MQRGVHDLEPRFARGRAAAGRHLRHVGVGGLIGRAEVEGSLGPALGQVQWVGGVDGRGDVRVDGRQQLPAVTHVDLEPVVLARVVAGGHLDAVGRVQVADREGQHRGRQRPGQQPGADPGPGQDPGGVGGEDRGIGAAVVADDNALGGRGRIPVLDVPGQAGGHAPDHQPVHPHRPGADLGPDAGRAEGQLAVESFGQRGGVCAADQLVHLGAGDRVRVGVPPGGGRFGEAARLHVGQFGGHCVVADSATGAPGRIVCGGGQMAAAAQ